MSTSKSDANAILSSASWLHDTSHTEMSEIAAAADMSDRMSEAGSMDGEATRSIRQVHPTSG